MGRIWESQKTNNHKSYSSREDNKILRKREENTSGSENKENKKKGTWKEKEKIMNKKHKEEQKQRLKKNEQTTGRITSLDCRRRRKKAQKRTKLKPANQKGKKECRRGWHHSNENCNLGTRWRIRERASVLKKRPGSYNLIFLSLFCSTFHYKIQYSFLRHKQFSIKGAHALASNEGE